VFPPSIINLRQGQTRPLDPRVARAVAAALEGSTSGDEVAADLLDSARGRVASLLGALPEEIIFTSGATEANNLALKGIGLAAGDEILVARTEHTSVLYPARSLEKMGIGLGWIEVDRQGRVDPQDLRRRLGPRTRLVAVMAANNETGTLQPVAEIGAVCREAGVSLLADAAAAAGVAPIRAHDAGADFISVSSHKMGGPPGAGALFFREGVRLLPLLEGGIQEGGRRGGSENLPGIAGFGEAAAIAQHGLEERAARMRLLRDRLWAEIRARIPGAVRHGSPEASLPGHLSISIPGAEGEALTLGLRRRGVAASTGSDCASHAGKPSHVLLAMGVGEELARCSLAFVAGGHLSEDEITRAAAATAEAAERLRSVSGIEAAPTQPREDRGAPQRSSTAP
jgi:cysteine desulfurase